MRRRCGPSPGGLDLSPPASPRVLESFAEAVGCSDPVSCVGGRTHWDAGGELVPGTRHVHAPAGVVAHEPGEMIVRVRAGTTVAEVARATAAGGQFVALEADHPEHATVGGTLATGRSGLRRLGWGPVRDSVLEITAVASTGELIRAGAPLVKNVTGYDLCRLFVGSLGTLAFLAEVVLRCRPLPEVERWWWADDADPFALQQALYRPVAVLWDGRRTWVGLAGYHADVEYQRRAVLGPAFEEADGPPAKPGQHRRSMTVGALRSLPRAAGSSGCWMAEMGVGLVHCDDAAGSAVPIPPVSAAVASLNRRVKERFDPHGRLNPGRSVLAGGIA